MTECKFFLSLSLCNLLSKRGIQPSTESVSRVGLTSCFFTKIECYKDFVCWSGCTILTRILSCCSTRSCNCLGGDNNYENKWNLRPVCRSISVWGMRFTFCNYNAGEGCKPKCRGACSSTTGSCFYQPTSGAQQCQCDDRYGGFNCDKRRLICIPEVCSLPLQLYVFSYQNLYPFLSQGWSSREVVVPFWHSKSIRDSAYRYFRVYVPKKLCTPTFIYEYKNPKKKLCSA